MKLTKFLEKYNLDIKVIKGPSKNYIYPWHVILIFNNEFCDKCLLEFRTKTLINGLDNIFTSLRKTNTICVNDTNTNRIKYIKSTTKESIKFQIKIDEYNIKQKILVPENITYDDEFLFEKYLKIL